MVIEVNKKSLVVQHNKLVEAKYRLSVEEQKIIKILISQIQREDEDFKDYEFHVKELAELMGMQHKDPYGVLQSITKKLTTKGLEFHDPASNTLIQTAWLSGAKYKIGEGTVILHFDPLLKPLLLQLQSYFTKYELRHILRFKGQYTIRFFEFRRSFLGKNRKDITFSMKELRGIFGLNRDEYKEFSDFKRRVLESARLELLEKTGKSFTWEAVREGRGGKVTGIRFVFDEDNEDQEPEILEDEIPTSIATPALMLQKGDKTSAMLVGFGMSPAVAEELIVKYEEPYILEKIALMNAHVGPMKSKAGFVIKALQEDWKDSEQEERRRHEERQQAVQAEQDRKARLRAIRENFNLHAKNHGLRQYEQLPEETKRRFKEEFLGTLSGILANRFAHKPEFGFEDPYYRAFVMQHKLPPLTFEAYLNQAGLALSPEDTRDLQAL